MSSSARRWCIRLCGRLISAPTVTVFYLSICHCEEPQRGDAAIRSLRQRGDGLPRRFAPRNDKNYSLRFYRYIPKVSHLSAPFRLVQNCKPSASCHCEEAAGRRGNPFPAMTKILVSFSTESFVKSAIYLRRSGWFRTASPRLPVIARRPQADVAIRSLR